MLQINHVTFFGKALIYMAYSTERPTIHIAAGGNGTRIREGMDYLGFDTGFPKHLLPTGGGETLLGRIVRQAQKLGHVAIHANYDNVRQIGESSDIAPDVALQIARNSNGPLSPVIHDILRTGERSFSSAGDYWADFEWTDFLAFHQEHDQPVSILVGPSVPAKEGARFDVAEDGRVRSWERVEKTTERDLINIGAYIIDPEKLVLKILREMTWHKEDPFNDAMIEQGLMAAYALPTPAFNVNTPEVYASLIQHTSEKAIASPLAVDTRED